ncbi:MAG: MaoC family dehydratase [Alphaproteobacteria bacterium]|nr:MaoC family dehydratase [Alphaproteobacteria bacterium]
MSAVYARTVTDADIVMFSGISGDTNPIHLAATFADGSMFGGRVAHGMLTASFFSAVIGTKLPGPGCVYMSQTLRWNAPVRAGDTVVTRAVITELNDEKQRAKLETACTVGGEVVLEGEALVKVPSRLATG